MPFFINHNSFQFWTQIWLFFHWKSYTFNHVDQLVYYIFFFAAICIFLSACKTQYEKKRLIQYVVNQTCKIDPVASTFNICFQVPFFGKLSMKEILVYCLSGATFITIAGLSSLPFAISYDPVQLIIGCNTFYVKIFAVFLSWWCISFVAATILSILLITIAFLEGVHSYSKRINFQNKWSSTLTKHKLYDCCIQFRILVLFVTLGNDMVE